MTHASTKAVRAALESDTQHGSVIPPLFLSTNFTFEGYQQKRQYDYTRSGNPTRDAFAEALAQLEQGAGATIVSSGMAAITLVCQLLKPDDLLVVPHDCYGGSYRLFTHLSQRGAFKLKVIDLTNSENIEEVIALKPAWLWIETPSNPLLRLTDIQRWCEAAHAIQCKVCVDNTFLSPLGQNPITLGADLVLHSTTKYINGHSDVVGGAVIAADPQLAEELAWWANCLGLTGSPFDAWLSLRGLRTLDVRLRQQTQSSQQIAEFLSRHPAVQQVYYPGLAEHPQHSLAKLQQQQFGAIISFAIDEQQVPAFLNALQYFSLAESLGGIESLIAHPASMTHAAMDERARIRAGIGNGLLRLSIGLEHCDDLIADLNQALSASCQSLPLSQSNTSVRCQREVA